MVRNREAISVFDSQNRYALHDFRLIADASSQCNLLVFIRRCPPHHNLIKKWSRSVTHFWRERDGSVKKTAIRRGDFRPAKHMDRQALDEALPRFLLQRVGLLAQSTWVKTSLDPVGVKFTAAVDWNVVQSFWGSGFLSFSCSHWSHVFLRAFCSFPNSRLPSSFGRFRISVLSTLWSSPDKLKTYLKLFSEANHGGRLISTIIG